MPSNIGTYYFNTYSLTYILMMAVPLEPGQTTLITSLTSALQHALPEKRPGPKSKTSSHSVSRLPISCLPRKDREQRFIGGVNEQRVREMFQEYWRAEGDTETDNIDNLDTDSLADDEILDYIPRKRHSYPREHKLAAIEYFQTTWVKKKDNTKEQISVCRACQKLKIDRKSLRRWILNKQKIIDQPKGSRRVRKGRTNTKGREHQLELQLNKEFKTAQAKGRKIDDKWLLRHAKIIYR
jgi:hypothetical protein